MHKNKGEAKNNGTADASFPKISGYQVQHVIGNGSDANVYAAKCLKTGRKVAIKVFDKRKQSKEGLQRTKQEIKLMSELDHPNVIKIYEAFDHQNKRFIVMEHAAQGDLFEALYGSEANPSQTVMKESKARKLFVQVVSAIRHCHRRGIVHRDIKPENIFLDERGNVKLGDFGLAMRFKPDSAVRQPVGSLLYASPEVLQHQPYVGPELDVWGLGILLYEMLCGTPPFSADSEQETCDKILRGDYAIPKYLSTNAQQLISSMIKISKLRATISDIIKHPWCRDEFARLETAYRSKRRDRESGDMLVKARSGSMRDPRKISARSTDGPRCFDEGPDCAMWSPSPSPNVTRTSRRRKDSCCESEDSDDNSEADSGFDSSSDEEHEEEKDENEEERSESEDSEEEEDGYSTDESGSDLLISPRGGEKPCVLAATTKPKGGLARGLSKAMEHCRLEIPVLKLPQAKSHKKTERCREASKSPRSSSSPALNY